MQEVCILFTVYFILLFFFSNQTLPIESQAKGL